MPDYMTRDIGNNVRCRWVIDDDYSSIGRFALNTEEETKAAERAEMTALQNGEVVALGCIVERWAKDCSCPHCTGWHRLDDLWGIVIQPDPDELDAFALEAMDFGGVHLCAKRYAAPVPLEPDAMTCGACGLVWCERCDPTPGAMCHRCHGRGYSTAELA